MIRPFLLLLILFFAFDAKAQRLKVVTTDFPPFQISRGEDLVEGASTEIVKEVIKEAGLQADFKVYPWPRAYKIAQNEPNVIIYSIVRNEEREKLFKWIGVIAPFDVYFWKLSNRPEIKIENFLDAKRYLVGGVNFDIKAVHLEKNGFIVGKNLALVNSDDVNLKMLYAKKIDLLPADEYSFPYRAKMNGYEASTFTRLAKIEGIPTNLNMAASLQTSDEIVAKLKNSLEKLHKSKKFKKIQNKIRNQGQNISL